MRFGILKRFLSFLFPTKCVDCRREGCWICEFCIRKIPLAERPDEDWIISVWSYKDRRIKKLLWRLKFENKFSVAEDLGLVLFDHLSDELSERAIFENNLMPILVPIPLSRKTFRKRGYNQSGVLAKELSKRSAEKIEVLENVLIKIKETPTQHSIKNKAKRLKNLRGSFGIKNSEVVRGKNIVLIDDITTTHATLREARKTLKSAGVKNVLAFTVAH